MVLFFVCFSISRAGFNSVARKPLRSVSGSINGVGSQVSKAIQPLYSKSRGYRSRHLHLTHEDRISVL